MFQADNITCARNNRVLFLPVNFELSVGQVVYISGPNGIGKTTLLRSLAGLTSPFSGAISWQNETIIGNDDYYQQIFFLGHKNAIKSSLTVIENILYSPSLTFKTDKWAASEMLSRLNLECYAEEPTGSLSSGQKQRLAIAKAFLSGKRLLILDEPFSSLDQEGIAITQELMRQHVATEGMIIFTSHQAVTAQFKEFKTITLRGLDEHPYPFERREIELKGEQMQCEVMQA